MLMIYIKGVHCKSLVLLFTQKIFLVLIASKQFNYVDVIDTFKILIRILELIKIDRKQSLKLSLTNLKFNSLVSRSWDTTKYPGNTKFCLNNTPHLWEN